ncbi:hypothetical protein AURANDRAFT_27655 [Aureococcus anophagefferens]|uniref:Uncharacterized protein ODC1 n=1 Tax=Aureococcus anophagefferens TaxID=44056 RepID=F0YCA8_AURAN|nr:hypothetical protein AURANDRAFT_27655 [Aureococcus anophagefferens]EGB07419.1 hypothetical protein AURANDRAFT_27655 [Aureococcus anophagefferens]|eukprot:XP_009038036.1 hypothetical protein AURANDRAFT_27655 [Aureococcus anophagefferens]
MLDVASKFSRSGESPRESPRSSRPRSGSLSTVQADAWRTRDERLRCIAASWTARVEAEVAAVAARGGGGAPRIARGAWPGDWPSRAARPAAAAASRAAAAAAPPAPSPRGPPEARAVPNGRACGLRDYCASVVAAAPRDYAGPFYVVDVGAAERLYDAWAAALPRVRPHYAVKCFPDAGLCRALAAKGCGFDCASEAECRLVFACGATPRDVVFANPCKRPSDVNFLAASGVPWTTFDCCDELAKLAGLLPGATRAVLRLRCDDPTSRLPFGPKYGALEDEVPGLLAAARAAGVAVAGVSFHVGSGARSPAAFAAAIAAARRAFDANAAAGGAPFDVLDIGGGFCGGFDASGTAAVSASGDATVAAAVNAALDLSFPASDFPGLDVIAEPGRYFAEAAASLCCRVVGERHRSRADVGAPPEPEAQYWITDGVYGAFNAIIYDGWLPHAVVVDDPRRAHGAGDAGGRGAGAALTTVFGPTCDSLDVVFSRVRNAPPLRRDDWLLFPCCGAYTSAGAADFNGIPATAAAGVETRYVRSDSMRCTADDDALGLLYSDKPPMEIIRYCD